jgi:hypothetical protein
MTSTPPKKRQRKKQKVKDVIRGKVTAVSHSTVPAIQARPQLIRMHELTRQATIQNMIAEGTPYEALVPMAAAAWNVSEEEAEDEVRNAFYALQHNRSGDESRRMARSQLRLMYFNLYKQCLESDHHTRFGTAKQIADSLVALDRLHEPDIAETQIQHRADLAMLGYSSAEEIREAMQKILVEAAQLPEPIEAECSPDPFLEPEPPTTDDTGHVVVDSEPYESANKQD